MEDQAGIYSATLAYLRAVRDAKTVEGETVVETMRRTPINDTLFGPVTIRPDGRLFRLPKRSARLMQAAAAWFNDPWACTIQPVTDAVYHGWRLLEC